jgi:SAM-dependent methyltransferase
MNLRRAIGSRIFDGRTLSRRILDRELARVLAGASADTVLDVGGATGTRYRALVQARRYWTLDVQPQHRPSVRGDAHALPFRDGSADLVVCLQVLEHCIRPAVVLDEIFRVLRPGGRLVLSTVLVYELHGSPHDYYRFTASALEDLARAFARVRIHPMGNRFVGAYDLTCARAPLLNALCGPLAYRFGTQPSADCPCGFIIDATRSS